MTVTIIPILKPRRKWRYSISKVRGVAHREICRLCRISKPTLVAYLKQYQASGIEQLKKFGYQGMSSELDKHGIPLESYFKEHPPRTVAEAQYVIQEQTGIERCPTQIQAFLKRLGMKCRKVGSVPGHAASPDKQAEQETFKTHELEPRLAEAKAGKRRVLFMDAAHFVLCVGSLPINGMVFYPFVYCVACRATTFQCAWRGGCRNKRNLHDYKRNIHQRRECLSLAHENCRQVCR